MFHIEAEWQSGSLAGTGTMAPPKACPWTPCWENRLFWQPSARKYYTWHNKTRNGVLAHWDWVISVKSDSDGDFHIYKQGTRWNIRHIFHLIDLKLTYRINYFTHYYFYFMGLILCFTLLVCQSISQFLIIFKSLWIIKDSVHYAHPQYIIQEEILKTSKRNWLIRSF